MHLIAIVASSTVISLDVERATVRDWFTANSLAVIIKMVLFDTIVQISPVMGPFSAIPLLLVARRVSNQMLLASFVFITTCVPANDSLISLMPAGDQIWMSEATRGVLLFVHATSPFPMTTNWIP